MPIAMPSTTIFRPGDVVLVAFPFSSGLAVKTRPALVLADTGDEDLLVARVTTQLHQTPFDVPLSEWRATGLLAPSVVRLHKLATLERNRIYRKLGRVQPSDHASVAAALKRTLENWL